MRTRRASLLRESVIGKSITLVSYPGLGSKAHGIIRDETRMTLVIDTDAGRKRFLKQALVFRMSHQGKQVEIEGKYLIGKITDRIKN